MLVGALTAAIVGSVIQQVFLRWNQGQDLRQALITLAIAVIVADQWRPVSAASPNGWSRPAASHHFIQIFGQRYATSRLFMLGVASVVGALLWLWLNRTRHGACHSGGVSTIVAMVRALGININAVFAVTFFVACVPGRMGGAMGASVCRRGPGRGRAVAAQLAGRRDHRRSWFDQGAAAGSLLYGLVVASRPRTCPATTPSTQSS